MRQRSAPFLVLPSASLRARYSLVAESWLARVIAMMCSAWLSWRSPPRLSRYWVRWPEEHGIGALPDCSAKLASDRPPGSNGAGTYAKPLLRRAQRGSDSNRRRLPFGTAALLVATSGSVAMRGSGPAFVFARAPRRVGVVPACSRLLQRPASSGVTASVGRGRAPTGAYAVTRLRPPVWCRQPRCIPSRVRDLAPGWSRR